MVRVLLEEVKTQRGFDLKTVPSPVQVTPVVEHVGDPLTSSVGNLIVMKPEAERMSAGLIVTLTIAAVSPIVLEAVVLAAILAEVKLLAS